MGILDKLFSGKNSFSSVLVETQNKIFEIYGVAKPSDAQKMKATFYLCISGIAIMNDQGAGAVPHVIDKLVADTRELTKPLSMYVEDISNSPDQLEQILWELPDGATGSTRVNGPAAFQAMYMSIGEDLMNDIVSHHQGPMGTPGYAGVIVVDGIFGEGKATEHFMEVCMQMLSFTKGLVDAA